MLEIRKVYSYQKTFIENKKLSYFSSVRAVYHGLIKSKFEQPAKNAKLRKNVHFSRHDYDL